LHSALSGWRIVQIANIPSLDLLRGLFTDRLPEPIGELPESFGAEIAKTKLELCAF
jgi:hypothetical protein